MDQDKPGIHCEKLAVQRGNVRLEVELRCPIDPAGPRPAVVFFPGSGISPFWDYVPGFLEWFVDGVFLPRGFCVLYMNKRGIGASEGNWQRNSFQGRADDAHAAVRLLRAHAAIDSHKSGLIGHSQGGWIANLAAAQHSDIAFFISLAGPTTTVAEQIRHTIEIEAACRNENAEKPRNSSQLKRQIAWQAAQRRAGAVLGMFPFGQAGHLARLYGYDPRAAIREARCPGLYVFAGLDSMVPAEPNLERFAKIWQSNPPANLSTAVIPDTDHHFHITDTICFDREESRRKPFSPVLVEVLQEWLAAHNL